MSKGPYQIRKVTLPAITDGKGRTTYRYELVRVGDGSVFDYELSYSPVTPKNIARQQALLNTRALLDSDYLM